MLNKFNELLLKPDIIELYNEGITPNYGYLLNGRLEKDMVRTLYPLPNLNGNPITWEASETEYLFPNVSFEPKQAGSGDPSPENVRPISGYDEVTANGRGKNYIDFNSLTTEAGAYDKETGELTSPIGNQHVTEKFTVYAGTVVFQRNDEGENIRLFFWGNDGYISNELLVNNSQVTIPEGARLMAVQSSGSGFLESQFVSFSIGTSTDEPYQPGTTATLTLPETIYGGTVDAVTGKGKKTIVGIELTGEETVVAHNTENAFRVNSVFSMNTGLTPANEIFCSHYLSSAIADYGFWHNTGTSFAIFRDVRFSTPEEFKSYLAAQYAAGTPVTIAYQLATPESFQATGNRQLTSLAGYNTIYTNGDSITLSRKVRRLEV